MPEQQEEQRLIHLTLTPDQFTFVNAACATLAMDYGAAIGKMKPAGSAMGSLAAFASCTLVGWDTINDFMQHTIFPLGMALVKEGE